MSTPFDASLAYTGPISAETQAANAAEVEHCGFMPGKLANAKLHANNEVQRWVLSTNRLIWGEMPADLRQPANGEVAALLEQLPPDVRERLLKESQAAAAARHLVTLLEVAEGEAQARLEAQQAEEARAEAEERARLETQAAELARAELDRALRAEFEEVDAAGKEARFQSWVAARG